MQLQKQSLTTLMPIFQNESASLRFLTDDQGVKTDIVLSMKTWQDLVHWLEDVEDRILIQSWTPRLTSGPKKSGALKWDDVADEWMSDE